MSIRIGIPRGLWYYDYAPLWISFYESLGAEVIVSDVTNQEILNRGVKNTVDAACLPVKIFNGHVMNLKDRVDYLFIPRMMSVYPHEYICPKFCGLPELVKSAGAALPPLIDQTINFNHSRRHLHKTIYKFGAYVTPNPFKIRKAYGAGLAAYYDYRKCLEQGQLPIDGILMDQGVKMPLKRSDSKRIAVLGHPYQLYDSFSSMKVLEKLIKNNVEIIIPEMLNMKKINQRAATLEKPIFWSYGRKVLGTGLELLHGTNVDGIIYVSAFGCGIDSIVEDLLEKWTREKGEAPFLLLTLDEHTGEAGVDTRIEAFLDMIEWRKKDEGNLSPYGKSIHSHQSASGGIKGRSDRSASM